MDLFAFPSNWEDLPQAMVEAQAAGLRCLCANTVTPEVVAVPDAVVFMGLAEGAARWADACAALLDLQPLDPAVTAARISTSPFSIDTSVTTLSKLYSAGQRA